MSDSTALKIKTPSVIPESIKQIGAVENDMRIYIEDYVYTYLNHYAKIGGSKEKLGVFVGKHIFNSGHNVLIINGFIQGKEINLERGSATFSNESWDYINQSKDKYFKDCEILGWVHTQPGFGSFLMSKDESYHNKFFPHDHQILYITDPSEKTDTFYIRNKESDRLCAAKGYFIYYDNNEPMQSYMEDNRLVRKKEPRFVPDEEKSEKKGLLSLLKNEAEEENFNDPASVGRTRLKKRSASENQKRKFAVLGSVSAILCASCIMICLNVMNHSERIHNLEAEINSNFISQSDDAVTVFSPLPEEDDVSASTLPLYTENIEETDIPAATETEARTIPEYYIVEEGDSLSYISRKFYGDDSMITAIMAENNIVNSDRIYYGKKIILP